MNNEERKDGKILIIEGTQGAGKSKLVTLIQMMFEQPKYSNFLTLTADPDKQAFILKNKETGPIIVDEIDAENKGQVQTLVSILRNKEYKHIDFIILTQEKLPGIFYQGTFSWTIINQQA